MRRDGFGRDPDDDTGSPVTTDPGWGVVEDVGWGLTAGPAHDA